MNNDIYSGFIATDGGKQLSANFKLKEFKSRTNPAVFISRELIEVLQSIRNKLGSPININSGYRTQEHNKSVGGSINSAHLIGCAADISSPTVKAVEIARIAYALYGKKIAIGLHTKENYVHIDIIYRGNHYAESLSNKVTHF